MATKYGLRYVEFASMNGESSTLGRYVIPSSAMARAGARVSAYGEVANYDNNNNNNTLIYIAPACRMTSEALADSSSRATECLTEK